MLEVSESAAHLVDLRSLLRSAEPSGELGRRALAELRPFGPAERSEWAAERKACDVLRGGLDPEAAGALAERLAGVEPAEGSFARALAGDADESDLFRLKRFLFQSWRIATILAEAGVVKGYEAPPLDAPTLESALRLLQPSGELRSRFTLSDEADPALAGLRASLREFRSRDAELARRARGELEARWGLSLRPSLAATLEGDAAGRVDELVAGGEFVVVSSAHDHVELAAVPSPEHGAVRARAASVSQQLDVLEAACVARLGREAATACAGVEAHERWLGRLDLRLAKLRLSRTWTAWPSPADSTSVRGAWLPAARERVERAGGRWQAVDIEVGPGVTLLTGPNMGGKTVALAVLAAVQVLAQYGFPVPALEASFRWASRVGYIGGELGSFAAGLSSFAAEMDAIGRALRAPDEGLLLIDELANGTSPDEGQAVASAVVDALARRGDVAVVVTHFPALGVGAPEDASVERTAIRRLRVRGLMGVDDEALRSDAARRGWQAALNAAMDYRLVEARGESRGSDAIRVAEMVGVPAEVLAAARRRLGAEEGPR